MIKRDRKYGRPEDLSAALTRFLRQWGRPEQAMLSRLWQHWPMVMGPELAELAWPLGQKNGMLLVGGEDAMAMQELSLMSEEILDRANAFMDMDTPFFTSVKVSLSLGKTPLDTAASLEKKGPPQLEKGPVLSGKFLEGMDPTSAVARAYARYVQKNARN